MQVKYFQNSAEVYPYEGNTFNRIHVYRPRNEFRKDQLSEVNWSAIGSVSPEEAEQYAAGIKRAASIARRWNKKFLKASKGEKPVKEG